VYFVQVARAILENPKDKTKISLIYANVTYEDILLKVRIFCCTKYMMFVYTWDYGASVRTIFFISIQRNERLRTILGKWRFLTWRDL
jgi:NAD(P)H-flavin reductase